MTKINMQHVTGFGLSFATEMQIPELHAEKIIINPDVTIRYGRVPDKLEDSVGSFETYDIAKTESIVRVPGIAQYHISDGCRIVVQPEDSAEDKAVRLFLLSTPMACLLQQRSMFALHGSAISKDDQAIILAGSTGSGKSTVAKLLTDKGWKLLCDDICVIDTVKNLTPAVLPGEKNIRLWRDSLEWLNIDTGQLPRIRKELEKFVLPQNCVEQQESYPISSIFVLERGSGGPTVECQETDFLLAIDILNAQIYRREICEVLGEPAMYLKPCGVIARQANVRKINIPERLNQLAMVVEQIEDLT